MTNNQIIEVVESISDALTFGDAAEALRLATELAATLNQDRDNEFAQWSLRHPEVVNATDESDVPA